MTNDTPLLLAFVTRNEARNTDPSVAAAHPIKGVGDFYAGMLHPLTALEFLLPWIAVALFAGQQGRKAALLTLGIFPVALMSGAGLALIVPITNFPDLTNGTAPVFGAPIQLDLRVAGETNGRGIRDVVTIGDQVLIVAGPPADALANPVPAVWSWPNCWATA